MWIEMKIRVLIADDHLLLRQGIRKVLELEPDFEVVDEAMNGQEALSKTLILEPDILLLDLNMPMLNGVEVARQLKSAKAKTKIIVLTMHDDDNYVIELLRSGAAGYLLKDVEPSILIKAIRMVKNGESFIYPEAAESLFGVTQCSGNIGAQAEQIWRERRSERLTARELDVLRCIAQGFSNQDIAKTLFVSEKTVKNHLTNIFRKINVNDRTQALLYVLKNKIMTLE